MASFNRHCSGFDGHRVNLMQDEPGADPDLLGGEQPGIGTAVRGEGDGLRRARGWGYTGTRGRILSCRLPWVRPTRRSAPYTHIARMQPTRLKPGAPPPPPRYGWGMHRPTAERLSGFWAGEEEGLLDFGACSLTPSLRAIAPSQISLPQGDPAPCGCACGVLEAAD